MLRHAVRLAVATFAVAAAGVVVSPSSQAATCSGSSGVTVVVDFHQLRSGGAQASCDAGGAGKYAAAQLTDVGHTLTYVQGEPFVCLVDGLGSSQCVRTPPADAYWSLWWSDGKSGTWTYSSLGVASLKVPAGGYVALSWQQGSHQVPPRIAAKAHSSGSPTSSPTSAPTSHPTSKPTARATDSSTSSPTSAPTSSDPAVPSGSTTSPGQGKRHDHAGPSKRPHARASRTSGAQASAPTQGVVPAGSGSGSGGLPGWVAPLAVVAVFAVGATVALVRRKSSGGT